LFLGATTLSVPSTAAGDGPPLPETDADAVVVVERGEQVVRDVRLWRGAARNAVCGVVFHVSNDRGSPARGRVETVSRRGLDELD